MYALKLLFKDIRAVIEQPNITVGQRLLLENSLKSAEVELKQLEEADNAARWNKVGPYNHPF